MKLLAIDTSTEACSASLLIDETYYSEFRVAPRAHTQLIFPMMESLLNQGQIQLRDVDAFAFGRGPGSFTGVRLAASLIQGVAFAMNKPVIAVSTLQAMAQGAIRQWSSHHVLTAIDARMHEVYWCAYACDPQGIAVPMTEEQVCSAEDVIVPGQFAWTAVGSGWKSYQDRLEKKINQPLFAVYPDCYPNAQDIAYLAQIAYHAGDIIDPEQAIPIYLRDKVTT